MTYYLIGTYRGESELIDETSTRQDAEYLRGEYQLAYGAEWTVRITTRKPKD